MKQIDFVKNEGRPNQPLAGMGAGYLIDQWQLWHGEGEDELPPEERLKEVADRAERQDARLAVVDIEHWPTEGTAKEVNQTLDNIIHILDGIKAHLNPGIKLGLYGICPTRNYWSSLPRQGAHQQWLRDCHRTAVALDHVDVVCPSLYTFYPDGTQWAQSAISHIEWAFSYGDHKPVYPFVWHKFHESSLLGGDYIGDKLQNMQLALIDESYAEGVCVWGGPSEKYDANDVWWRHYEEYRT